MIGYVFSSRVGCDTQNICLAVREGEKASYRTFSAWLNFKLAVILAIRDVFGEIVASEVR